MLICILSRRLFNGTKCLGSFGFPSSKVHIRDVKRLANCELRQSRLRFGKSRGKFASARLLFRNVCQQSWTERMNVFHVSHKGDMWSSSSSSSSGKKRKRGTLKCGTQIARCGKQVPNWAAKLSKWRPPGGWHWAKGAAARAGDSAVAKTRAGGQPGAIPHSRTPSQFSHLLKQGRGDSLIILLKRGRCLACVL